MASIQWVQQPLPNWVPEMVDNVMVADVAESPSVLALRQKPPVSRQSSAPSLSPASEDSTLTVSPQSTITALSNGQFLQKPMGMHGGTTFWSVPPAHKYTAEQAKDMPAAARLHALSIHRIEKHWRGVDVATCCLPPELEKKTPYSLAMLTRLDKLAYLTAKKHDEALRLMRYAHKTRRAVEEASVPKPHSRVSTMPKDIWKQCKVHAVEPTVWENREGLLLQDIDQAIAIILAENKKERNQKQFLVPEGQTKREVKKRVMKERRNEKREVEKVIRTVVGSKVLGASKLPIDGHEGNEKQQNEYKEVEKMLGRGLRKGERKQVGRTRRKIAASTAEKNGLKYSLAWSGPSGSISVVQGLEAAGEGENGKAQEKTTKQAEKKPGLSEEGLKFIQENNYIDKLSLEDLIVQKALSTAKPAGETMDLDAGSAQDTSAGSTEHSKTGTETGAGKGIEQSLSSAMREHSISQSKGSELRSDNEMQL
ncbi:hypothetical protein CB0940_07799 [Cercospora beticola]|uniref:Uncharacterized protein n=1 Tax=Cercospora beticola TaxID=122368 RepID=A0A2G5H8W0_CERBT|nr:hypothetical protein CB0940_07799 [Cercospora beticola]PIA88966.1 hypothetical protein CB0940_07799 [Cercospora beticola]WPB03767.1 hypothetical protein RHO25_008411 [Cercospora beticola]CAK1357468.1 unnamed protein product [Cercospora beticola]